MALSQDGESGLEYIDLTWKPVKGAEKYVIYVNNTKTMETTKTAASIKNLHRSTYYSLKVATVNMAGEGNASKPEIFRTSDISENYNMFVYY